MALFSTSGAAWIYWGPNSSPVPPRNHWIPDKSKWTFCFSINVGTKVHRHSCTCFLLSACIYVHNSRRYLIEMHEPQIFILNYITWNSIDDVNYTVAMKGMVKVKKEKVIYPSFKLMKLYVKAIARFGTMQ